MKEKLGLYGLLNLKHFDSDGNILEDRLIKNQIQTVGKATIAQLLAVDVSDTAFDYIAIGSGTGQGVGTTALASEITTNGGTRRGGANVVGTNTTTTTTNDTAQFVTTFTFTGTLAITEEGIFNGAGASDMLAYQSFTALNVASGDSLQVTHKIVVA